MPSHLPLFNLLQRSYREDHYHYRCHNNTDLSWNSTILSGHYDNSPHTSDPPCIPRPPPVFALFFLFSPLHAPRLRCQARQFTMSVVASRPQNPAVPYTTSQDAATCKEFAVAVQPVTSRTSSVSSYRTNYTTSTAPTGYTPSSPTSSYRQFDSIGSIPKSIEPVERRIPQEVYDVILNNLEVLHKAPHQTGCTTCFHRDLHALSLTCRSWERAVRGRL